MELIILFITTLFVFFIDIISFATLVIKIYMFSYLLKFIRLIEKDLFFKKYLISNSKCANYHKNNI
jgi:hypothetical protein